MNNELIDKVNTLMLAFGYTVKSQHVVNRDRGMIDILNEFWEQTDCERKLKEILTGGSPTTEQK